MEAIAARFASTIDSNSIEDVRDHTPNKDGYDPELIPCSYHPHVQKRADRIATITAHWFSLALVGSQRKSFTFRGYCLPYAMTDDGDGPVFPPVMRAFQEATEQATRQQQELFRQFLGGGDSGGLAPQLGAMSQMATFKTRVQSGGRISIPDAEREALDIEEGDIVQTVVVPVKRNRSDTDE
jgi:hypothetical protein